MNPRLSDHIPQQGLDQDTFFIRSNYLLMLVGAFDSPLGVRREVTPDECAILGEWMAVSNEPTQDGVYLLNGSYENDDGLFPDAVLFGWFDGKYHEFEVSDGWFPEIRCWMEVPWLPDVWEAAKKLFYDDKRRFSG